MRIHRALTVCLALTAVASAGCSAASPASSGTDAVGASEEGTTVWNLQGDLEYLLRAQTLVAVEAITAIDEFETFGIRNVVYDVQVKDTLEFLPNDVGLAPAPEPARGLQRMILPAVDDAQPPKLEPGSPLDRVTHALVNWIELEPQVGLGGTNWSIQFLLEEAADGTLTFVHNDGSQYMNDELARLVEISQTESSDSLTVLRQLMVETSANLNTGEVGPLLLDFRESSRPLTIHEEWYRAAPADRPLDPELTPPDVLETLTPRGLYYFGGESEGDERYQIRISSPEGILFHGFAAEFGQATLLVPPSNELTIEVSGNGRTLSEPIPVELIELGRISTLDLSGPLAEIEAAEPDSQRLVEAFATLESDAEIGEFLDQFADRGTPGPEPDSE